MKNRIILFALSVILFVVLLYHQVPGINFIIYGIFIVAASYFYSKKQSKERLLLSAFLIINTLSTAIYGPNFATFLSVFMFVLVPVYMYYPKESILMAPIQSAVSYFLSVSQISQFLKDTQLRKSSNSMKKFLFYFLIPLLGLIIFTFIYQTVNVDFKEALEQIQFPDIDSSLLLLIVLACIYCFGLWYYKQWISPQFYENYTNEDIIKKDEEYTQNDSILSNSGIILLSVLNVLLIVLLYFECNEIYCNQGFEKLSQYSEDVHLSIQSVIGSIILAVGIIMAYLYGKLNFGPKSTLLKSVAYIWIILNIALIVTTAIKNNLYIENSGLTEKRLGVYAFLLLALIGLGVTSYKIAKNKTDYYLISTMVWVFLGFGTAIGPINWSKIITRYNIQQCEYNLTDLDIYYLETLEYNDSEMIQLYSEHPELFKNSNSKKYNKSPEDKAANKSLLKEDESFLSDNFYDIQLRNKYNFPRCKINQ